jgi:type VI secretion system secreted protein Hcp
MAVDMFLKLDGIDGESEDDAHKGEIDVLAFSWGMTQSGSMHIMQGGGSGKVSVQDMSRSIWIRRAPT